jgi:hypothetical protein
MFRAFVSALFVFALVGFVTAEEKKASGVNGTFESYKDGKLSVKGDDGKVHTFDVRDDAKVQVFSATAEKPTEAAAKATFATMKPGTPVRIALEGAKIVGIEVGEKKK